MFLKIQINAIRVLSFSDKAVLKHFSHIQYVSIWYVKIDR